MILKTLTVLLSLNFIHNANAAYEYEGEIREGRTSLPSSNPRMLYSLTGRSPVNEKTNSIPHFVLSEELKKDSLIEESNMTFEEECRSIEGSNQCVMIQEGITVPSDQNIVAIKSDQKLHLRKRELTINHSTFISKDEIVLQGDRIKAQLFFKTPKTLSIIPTKEYKGGINEIILTPLSYTFQAKNGLFIPSSSSYVLMDIDFEKKQYCLKYQCVGNLSFSDKFSENIKQESTPSSPKETRKLEEIKEDS